MVTIFDDFIKLVVFIVSYCMKLINDVIKGNRYGDNI